MQTSIHPKFHDDTTITCTSCGTAYKIPTTKRDLTVEVCANCHPFYTGEQRFLDTKGRVDEFLRKEKEAKEFQKKTAAKKKKKKDNQEKKTKSLRELLGEV